MGARKTSRLLLTNPRFQFHEVDLTDLESYRRPIQGGEFHTVWHLAANSDIGPGVANAHVDLRNTFLTTFNTLFVMREFGIWPNRICALGGNLRQQSGGKLSGLAA